MNIFVIILLALIQGAAELLPVSSSAHVILAEKLFGIDPTAPAMTFLLIMLHTGTMIAVLVYFWPRWKGILSKENPERWTFVRMVIYASAATAIIGLGLIYLIEKALLKRISGASVEDIFGNPFIIVIALGLVGIMIVISGLSKRKDGVRAGTGDGKYGHPFVNSIVTGLVQGLALPFRGFSRSGSTISAAMLLGMQRSFSEDFSFALAVVLTPPAILREYLRLRHSAVSAGGLPYLQGMIGMALSFLAGIIAIRWLTAWLEKGRWHFFGFYCLVLSCVILALSFMKILN